VDECGAVRRVIGAPSKSKRVPEWRLFVLVIIGFVVVLGSVVGGFMLEGGPLLVLMQWVEFLIIGGAAIGALLISAPAKLLFKILQKAISAIKGETITRQVYLSLLKLVYELLYKGQKEGWIALEKHIETPYESSIFNKYTDLMRRNNMILFMTDTFRMVIIGGIAPHDLEALMDGDIETQHADSKRPGMLLQKIGDSMPGLGIVAAVLGIVITMQAIDGPAAEIGHKVAAALVGTFLGIFLSYGFLQPLATNIDIAAEQELMVYEVIKSAITAFAKGFKPIVCVEFARRCIPDEARPSFEEMEGYVKDIK
jgi:chemotaxis protein MotA